MKRDKQLIRAILEYVEEHGDGYDGTWITRIQVPAESAEVLDYHVRLCFDAGFLKGSKKVRGVTRLRWQGYEYLDAPRLEEAPIPCR